LPALVISQLSRDTPAHLVNISRVVALVLVLVPSVLVAFVALAVRPFCSPPRRHC
jgi:hypothetical protein